MANQYERLGQSVGDYRLLQWLGGGGFGNVYLAEHLHDHTQVAIKVLGMRLTNPDDLRSFLNEARMFRLHHPHIMPLLDFGMSRQDEPFLVMDYAPKGTLRDRHPKGSRVPLPTIVQYATQIASALQYAHDQRLIHRDVKPENMLLRSDDILLLSDFGIATAAHSTHSLSAHAGVGGTVPYMAPEQLDGKPHPGSDQYALAVVIYEWLTGRCPFVGTTVEVVVQHATKSPPSMLEQVPTISSEVEDVLFNALAKDPKDRFASIRAFVSALQQASAQPAWTIPIPIVPMEPPPLSPTVASGASEPPPLSQPTPIVPMEPPPLSPTVASGASQPPPLSQPTPVWPVQLDQTIPSAPIGQPSATYRDTGMPFFEMPAQIAGVSNSLNNTIVPPQPSRGRRNLIMALAGGLVALLAGSGAAIAFVRLANPSCPPNQTPCNGTCVNVKTNSANCGSCNQPCPSGQNCVGGTCKCLSSQTKCNGTCIDLMNNSNHCGSCSNVCATDRTCVNGTCLCSSGKTECSNGTCFDLKNDSSHCGTCDNVCSGGKTCVDGTCQCPSNQTDCGGTCIDPKTDSNHCGTCDTVCPSGTTCINGTCCTACNGACVDLSNDPSNCGSCDNPCGSGSTCSGAICCPSGQVNCGGYCVSTSSNSSNCGSCGNVCPANSTCTGGTCKCNYKSCGSTCCQSGYSCVGGSCCGYTNCNGVCVDTSSDSSNCGSCGNACTSYEYCGSGTCKCSYPCGSYCCYAQYPYCSTNGTSGCCSVPNAGYCGNSYCCASGYTCCSSGCC